MMISFLSSLTESIPLPHEHLPPPVDALASKLLLEDIPDADYYLFMTCIVLTILAFVQLRAFSRPPPVPLKRLPKRPALCILFKPDDIVSSSTARTGITATATTATSDATRITHTTATATTNSTTAHKAVPSRLATRTRPARQQQQKLQQQQQQDNIFRRQLQHRKEERATYPSNQQQQHPQDFDTPEALLQEHFHSTDEQELAVTAAAATSIPQEPVLGLDITDDVWGEGVLEQHDNGLIELVTDEEEEDDSFRCLVEDEEEEEQSTNKPASEAPSMRHTDLLPDSFAPLLSSSQVEVLRQHLTADLLHAVQFKGSIRLRPGRHEIPLDKDNLRPQLILDVPAATGCRLSAVGVVGSDGFSSQQDLDVTLPTTSRSKPMVKHAGLVLDPPLPLVNVAPTLIHFPTLFQDNMVPTLRRIQIIRFFFDMIISISSFLEKCLWILESQCQIHLSKVHVTPIYKGKSVNISATTTTTPTSEQESPNDERPATTHPQPTAPAKEGTKTKRHNHEKSYNPEWRLSLSFSGHVLLFGWIPVPFISVTLPTLIIPQPHALLEYLLTSQPLASARLRRENIAKERLALAVLHTAESWQANLQVVATPPAVGVDVTLPGGVAVALEMALGKDPLAGRNRSNPMDTTWTATATQQEQQQQRPDDGSSIKSYSSWGTASHDVGSASFMRRVHSPTAVLQFDANLMVPWSIEFMAKGTVNREKLAVHILKAAARHESPEGGSVVAESQFGTRGSFAIWRVQKGRTASKATPESLPLRPRSHHRGGSFSHPELQTEDLPSVAAILLFPDETTSFHDDLRLLQYDFAFDVYEDSKVDAVTLTVGATHPMLNGGTMVTTILDKIYAYGSLSARENSILDPKEIHRKRNVLRHLPAMDFQFGIQNIYIPPESESYSDDGQTLFLPELEGGRMRVHLLGGIDPSDDQSIGSSSHAARLLEAVSEGIKLVADFEVGSLVVHSEGAVKEFPELDVFDGVKLRTLLSGIITGGIRAHLRPQKLTKALTTTGPNVFNPLEAYEIDFSRSSLSLKLKEYTVSLGHRRIIFPAESTFLINVIESVVDMGFEGKTQCELTWDFQGLSPILQVTPLGQSPEDAAPEDKQQASLLIAPLRQGRLSLQVSSVGGISINKAKTAREDKEGLYDWKFFNALVSPDGESMRRILDVLHDKRTMDKLLQVVNLISSDLYNILHYLLRQIWRAKEIFDKEGVSDPKHMIPMYKMSRLVSLFLTGDVDKVDTILPIVRKVVNGEGLDVVKVKDLARQYIEQYDDWAPEIDRAVRWLAVAFGPMAVSQPYVEEHVLPLAELPSYSAKFKDIPSATQLYQTLLDKPQLPLDPVFSSLVSRIAPYLTFKQIEFILDTRAPTDWQPSDLRRIRYVFSIKKKVLEIAESYGGLSFLPQSFLLSVFLGEATRSSHRASQKFPQSRRPRRRTGLSSRSRRGDSFSYTPSMKHSSRLSIMSRLRKKRTGAATIDPQLELVTEERDEGDFMPTPAERVASFPQLTGADGQGQVPQHLFLDPDNKSAKQEEHYLLGDSLLGPQDVAILLQAGLTSVMKSSTVVQLNQRMLLDLICSQPRSFAIAVLAEIGSPSGQGSPRGLTSALMALLELDQTSFASNHKIDMHALLESWLPGLKIPRREDYMAGGRWARQSYYEALFSVAKSILDDAETYMALKGHVQRVRFYNEDDPLPLPRNEVSMDSSEDFSKPVLLERSRSTSKLMCAIEDAKQSIKFADEAGRAIIEDLIADAASFRKSDACRTTISLYQEAFDACARVIALDKLAFQAEWFRTFYKRNYDALMIRSMFVNLIDDTDNVRFWLHALSRGAKLLEESEGDQNDQMSTDSWEEVDNLFLRANHADEQVLVDEILNATIYEESVREELRRDPLVRLLIPNLPGKYDFVIVTAMGVITEGKKGLELKNAFDRLKKERGVSVIRSDTATARSFEYNASKIQEAIAAAVEMRKPYGLLGYSQGCANALMAESILFSGSPKQQEQLSKAHGGGLVCRQLLFSAANGSFHGPAMEKKIERLIVMCEEFFKYQQGYFSRAFSSSILELLNSMLDSPEFHKIMGGAQSFLPDGCRAFWREAQHLPDVPTCTLKGVMEDHTTPESLEMLSHLLTKQSGSPLHDSQVHVFDAVGHPVYFKNRNGRVLRNCAIGEGAVQRTHHWSPLSDEVEFVRTAKDLEMASFDCAKDRHVFPWVDVNARFGFIKYLPEGEEDDWSHPISNTNEAHPLKLLSETEKQSK